MTATIPAQLCTLRLAQNRPQGEVAAHIGITQPALSQWENGRRTPRSYHAIDWADALYRRLAVTRHDHYIGDLQDVLPNLRPLRRTLGYHAADVARRLHVVGLNNIESRAARGCDLELVTTTRYLACLDCHIHLWPR